MLYQQKHSKRGTVAKDDDDDTEYVDQGPLNGSRPMRVTRMSSKPHPPVFADEIVNREIHEYCAKL